METFMEYEKDEFSTEDRPGKAFSLLAFMSEEKNAFVTAKSVASGVTFLYKLARMKDGFSGKLIDSWFVSAFTGTDSRQWDHYSYIGLIRKEPDNKLHFQTVGKIALPSDSEQSKAFAWIFKRVVDDPTALEGKVILDKLRMRR